MKLKLIVLFYRVCVYIHMCWYEVYIHTDISTYMYYAWDIKYGLSVGLVGHLHALHLLCTCIYMYI